MKVAMACEVEQSPREAQRDWVANWTPLLSKQGFRLSGQIDDMLTYTRRRLPASAAVIGLLVPVIGWLFLLFYRVDQSFTVSFEPSNPGCVIRLRGEAHARMLGHFHRAGFA